MKHKRIRTLLAAGILGGGILVGGFAPAATAMDLTTPVAASQQHPHTATVSAEQNSYRGVSSEFRNRTGDAVMLAYVPDGTHTGSENDPILLLPGEAATFSNGFREEEGRPEVRVRVHEAVQHPSGAWHKGPMKQVVTFTNWAWDHPRCEIQCSPYYDQADKCMRNHSDWHEYSEGEDDHQDSRGQQTYVKRHHDTKQHKVFQVELHKLCETPTQDHGNTDGN